MMQLDTRQKQASRRARFSTLLCAGILLLACPGLLRTAAHAQSTSLLQISKDHAVYIDAQQGDILTITTDHRMGTDPDLLSIYAPNGSLQERLTITGNTTLQVALDSGPGVYKILPVNYTYIHDYSIPGTRSIVVEPFDHEEFIRVTNTKDLYFDVPADTPTLTFYATTMWSHKTVTVKLYDPSDTLMHTAVMVPNTYHNYITIDNPTPGTWRTRFEVNGYSAAGAWVEGVPNFFADDPEELFHPNFHAGPAIATLDADASATVSTGARLGVNWWLDPYRPSTYALQRDAVVEAQMDTARLSVEWAYRERPNDNADPFDINWAGFNFSRLDAVNAAYFDDVVSAVPNAMPILMAYWDSSVSWQSNNPASWTQNQREEYAEFVLATMIHTVAPDLQDPPGSTPAYPYEYVELLNEPNLSMGNGAWQAYIEIVKTVGQRLKNHPDPRINSLKIVAPGVTPGWGKADQVMENWIGKLIDQADEFVDAINWHQYGYLRLEEHDRFAEDIDTIRTWLETRGDTIADEEFIMTELNQHGGPPTWWKRQDTFYASRWWAGASLAALRGGMDFFQYYKLIDDPPGTYNYKSMLFNNGPYDPPDFPGGPPHGRKPVYEAASFINHHRRDLVVTSTIDHPELAHAVTLSQDHSGLTVLLTNLFDRTIDLDLQVTLPPDMQTESLCMQLHWLDETATGSTTPQPIPAGNIDLPLTLAPRTIYAIDFAFPGCSCPADLNSDGTVNTQDFILFLSAWANEDPLADWNADGTINTQDFLAYLADWAAGC